MKEMFLYIDPLKQGLKLNVFVSGSASAIVFLYIDPLKQGLKPFSSEVLYSRNIEFLYIDPLKQGLKHLFWQVNIVIQKSFYT